jgi:hypothetical protein
MVDLKKDEEGSRPVPDPTVLTMEALLREVNHVKELVLAKVACIEADVIRVDKTTSDMPEAQRKDIAHVREFLVERFNTVQEQFRSVQTQFSERDTRVEYIGRDSKVAIDAALSAQEKSAGKQTESFSLSIDKSEKATAKSIDQLGEMVNSNFKALDDKISDTKERLTRLEGLGVGKLAELQNQRASNFNAANIVGMIMGGLGVIVAIVTIAMRHL